MEEKQKFESKWQRNENFEVKLKVLKRNESQKHCIVGFTAKLGSI
jgi:hypothetical protein